MFSVGFRLDVFIAVAAYRHDQPNGLAVHAHEEPVFPRFDCRDGLLLGEFPSFAIVDSTDAFDALMRILPVRLVDALHLNYVSHFCLSFFVGELAAPKVVETGPTSR
jgi:hypothetical protein